MRSLRNITYIFLILGVIQGCKRDDSLNPTVSEDGSKATLANNPQVSVGAPGFVYFSQDFSSSTDVATYQTAAANGTDANKFQVLSANGTNSIAIVNGKLQVVKNGGSNINRTGFQRTTLPSGPANFLRYSMEVTVSNNSSEITNGFQFTVGDFGNLSTTRPAIAAPGDGAIHSIFRVNPTVNPGEFRIVSGSSNQQTSEMTFGGTQTIIWYINNSGAPKGYTAPDGLPASVQDDYADIWVVNGTNAVLAIDEAPAVSPDKTLKGFKFANNPNFVATLDIDNIHLSEQASVVVPIITGVAPAPNVEVPHKTVFELLPLAKQLEVTYDDGSTEMVNIQWSPVGKYNMFRTGEYKALGKIIPRRGTINPTNYFVESKITVRDEIKIVNAFTPNGDGKNDTWLNPELKYYLNTSVEVFDRDGVRLFYSTDPNVGWDGKNKHGQIVAGSYSYIITIPHLSMIKRGVVTVIK